MKKILKQNRETINNKKNNKKNICHSIIFSIIKIALFPILFTFILKKKKKLNQKNFRKFSNSSKNFDNYKFAILADSVCPGCGLFSFYIHYLGCLCRFINRGFIPIIDLQSFPNVYNGFNVSSSNVNPWEYFFNQPDGYTLEEVKQKAKNVEYFKCNRHYYFNVHTVYSNKFLLDFYHTLAMKYLPIKNELIQESNLIRKNLFHGSDNILGILSRGTDYFAAHPRYHPIPPTPELIFQDIEEMDKNYKYDLFFLTTEDDIIRKKFINKFGKKLRYYKYRENIKYDYEKGEFLYKNIHLHKNFELNKIYLINIYILSKCIDIVTARTGGAIALFFLTEGFRNSKVYYLGDY